MTRNIITTDIGRPAKRIKTKRTKKTKGVTKVPKREVEELPLEEEARNPSQEFLPPWEPPKEPRAPPKELPRAPPKELPRAPPQEPPREIPQRVGNHVGPTAMCPEVHSALAGRTQGCQPDRRPMRLYANLDPGDAWPVRLPENTPCRWDLQVFDWSPVGIPTRWDEKRRRVILRGFFCSFACACAWIYAHCPFQEHKYMSWLRRLARTVYGVVHIRKALPREMLSTTNIVDFRRRSQEEHYEHVPDMFLYQVEYVHRLSNAHLTNEEMLQYGQTHHRRGLKQHPPPLQLRQQQQQQQQQNQSSGGETNAQQSPHQSASVETSKLTRKRMCITTQDSMESNYGIMQLLQKKSRRSRKKSS